MFKKVAEKRSHWPIFLENSIGVPFPYLWREGLPRLQLEAVRVCLKGCGAALSPPAAGCSAGAGVRCARALRRVTVCLQEGAA